MAEAVVRGSAPDFRGSMAPVGDSAGGGKASKPAPVAQSPSGATQDLQPANSNTHFQRQPLDEEETLMAKPQPGASAASMHGKTCFGVSASASPLLPGAGRPLDPAARDFMEPHFGHDFSQVRVHTGPKAEQAAASVQARAFTLGRDIVFGAQEFAPSSTAGRRLLAHELTHVVQQGAGLQFGIQRAVSYEYPTPEVDINPLDPAATIPGHPRALGYTTFSVNDQNAIEYKDRLEELQDLVFPLPEITSDTEGCVLNSKEIEVRIKTLSRVVMTPPLTRNVPKNEVRDLFGGLRKRMRAPVRTPMVQQKSPWSIPSSTERRCMHGRLRARNSMPMTTNAWLNAI